MANTRQNEFLRHLWGWQVTHSQLLWSLEAAGLYAGGHSVGVSTLALHDSFLTFWFLLLLINFKYSPMEFIVPVESLQGLGLVGGQRLGMALTETPQGLLLAAPNERSLCL